MNPQANVQNHEEDLFETAREVDYKIIFQRIKFNHLVRNICMCKKTSYRFRFELYL